VSDLSCVQLRILRSQTLSITSAAFGSAIPIFLAVVFLPLRSRGIVIDWSGNNIPYAGVDGRYPGPILKPLADGEHFGPGPGEF
jgi:hypothetical protein